MQEMDGLELIKEARRIHPEILAILMTGLATEDIKLKAKKEGVNGFFPKPIEWGELIGLLEVLTKTGKGNNQNSEKNNGKMKYSLFTWDLHYAHPFFTHFIRHSDVQNPGAVS